MGVQRLVKAWHAHLHIEKNRLLKDKTWRFKEKAIKLLIPRGSCYVRSLKVEDPSNWLGKRSEIASLVLKQNFPSRCRLNQTMLSQDSRTNLLEDEGYDVILPSPPFNSTQEYSAAEKVEGIEVIATTAKAEGITAAAKVEAKVDGTEVTATTAKAEGMEECVKLFFHRNTKNDISNRENYIRCKNKLRKAGINYKSYGLLSREYLEALKKVQKFKNDEATMNQFLDLLAFTYSRAYRRYRGKHIRN
ncbi:hypothetical protein LguiB_021543 [Lonicera macranthoides]